jgi:uncharacterized MAPEG superfamily protein
MTASMWMLLGFAAWTLLLLISTIGVYRWIHILMGRAPIAGFPADAAGGAERYQRATRAHANCIENLPVFGAIVLALYASGICSPVIDGLSIIVLSARVAQSLIHVCHVQTNAFVSARFTFFSVQLLSFLALIIMIVRHAAPT